MNLLLYFKNGKSIQYDFFTIATLFNETNNHVQMIEKYFVVLTAYIKIWNYPQFQKLKKKKKKKKKKHTQRFKYRSNF